MKEFPGGEERGGGRYFSISSGILAGINPTGP